MVFFIMSSYHQKRKNVKISKDQRVDSEYLLRNEQISSVMNSGTLPYTNLFSFIYSKRTCLRFKSDLF